MYNIKLKDYVAHEDDTLYTAWWNWSKSGGETLVLDSEDKFMGILGKCDWERIIASNTNGGEHVGNFVNKDCTTLKNTEDIYKEARNIFSQRKFNFIPVLDENRNVIDIFTRNRAFYKSLFDSDNLPRMHYARMIWDSAIQAKSLGYNAISIIEFGVAGGNGLLTMKFHAREIGHLINININVYGFDTSNGLPPAQNSQERSDILNMSYYWKAGLFKMDYERLYDKLEDTTLILGDMKDTCASFFEQYNPAPIGAIALDTDLYTSAVPVMKLLSSNQYKHLMPRIYLYADDIMGGYECVGENAAIKEFNERNKDIACISPEGSQGGTWWLFSETRVSNNHNVKVCHLFKHPDYTKYIRKNFLQLPLINDSSIL